MKTVLSKKTKTYDLLGSSKKRVLMEPTAKASRFYFLLIMLSLTFSIRHANAQDTEPVSTVVLSNLMVSEIINNPETMNVEGYYMEFSISDPTNLGSLVFQVERYPTEGEPEVQSYQMSVITKDDGIYLEIQQNQFLIENGFMKMHLFVDPEKLLDNTKYKLSGLDTQGLTIPAVEFSHFQQ